MPKDFGKNLSASFSRLIEENVTKKYVPSIYEAAKNLGNTKNFIRDVISNSSLGGGDNGTDGLNGIVGGVKEYGKNIANAPKQAIKDILSGNIFGNGKGMEAAIKGSDFEGMMDDDDDDDFGDLSFSDSDGGDDDDFSDADLDDIIGSSKGTTNNNSFTTNKDYNDNRTVNKIFVDAATNFSGDMGAGTVKAVNNSSNVNIALNQQLLNALGVMSNQVASIISFQRDAESQYFTRTMEIQGNILDILNEWKENGFGGGSGEGKEEDIDSFGDEDNKNLSTFEKIFGTGEEGSFFNLKEYFSAILDNVNEGYDDFRNMAGLMINMISGDPMAFISQMVVEKLIPGAMKEIAKDFDDIFKMLPMRLNDMFGDWADNSSNFILEKIGEFLHIDDDRSATGPNFTNYEKGQVPFDGITKKTIVDVIPTLLSKILSALNNDADELMFDYENNKWTSLNQQTQRLAAEKQKSSKENYSDLIDETKDRSKKLLGGNNEFANKQFEGDLDSIVSLLDSGMVSVSDNGALTNTGALRAMGVNSDSIKLFNRMLKSDKKFAYKWIHQQKLTKNKSNINTDDRLFEQLYQRDSSIMQKGSIIMTPEARQLSMMGAKGDVNGAIAGSSGDTSQRELEKIASKIARGDTLTDKESLLAVKLGYVGGNTNRAASPFGLNNQRLGLNIGDYQSAEVAKTERLEELDKKIREREKAIKKEHRDSAAGFFKKFGKEKSETDEKKSLEYKLENDDELKRLRNEKYTTEHPEVARLLKYDARDSAAMNGGISSIGQIIAGYDDMNDTQKAKLESLLGTEFMDKVRGKITATGAYDIIGARQRASEDVLEKYNAYIGKRKELNTINQRIDSDETIKNRRDAIKASEDALRERFSKLTAARSKNGGRASEEEERSYDEAKKALLASREEFDQSTGLNYYKTRKETNNARDEFNEAKEKDKKKRKLNFDFKGGFNEINAEFANAHTLKEKLKLAATYPIKIVTHSLRKVTDGLWEFMMGKDGWLKEKFSNILEKITSNKFIFGDVGGFVSEAKKKELIREKQEELSIEMAKQEVESIELIEEGTKKQIELMQNIKEIISQNPEPAEGEDRLVDSVFKEYADSLEDLSALARMGTKPGSIYVHDTHLESLLLSVFNYIRALNASKETPEMQNIAKKVQASDGLLEGIGEGNVNPFKKKSNTASKKPDTDSEEDKKEEEKNEESEEENKEGEEDKKDDETKKELKKVEDLIKVQTFKEWFGKMLHSNGMIGKSYKGLQNLVTGKFKDQLTEESSLGDAFKIGYKNRIADPIKGKLIGSKNKMKYRDPETGEFIEYDPEKFSIPELVMRRLDASVLKPFKTALIGKKDGSKLDGVTEEDTIVNVFKKRMVKSVLNPLKRKMLGKEDATDEDLNTKENSLVSALKFRLDKHVINPFKRKLLGNKDLTDEELKKEENTLLGSIKFRMNKSIISPLKEKILGTGGERTSKLSSKDSLLSVAWAKTKDVLDNHIPKIINEKIFGGKPGEVKNFKDLRIVIMGWFKEEFKFFKNYFVNFYKDTLKPLFQDMFRPIFDEVLYMGRKMGKFIWGKVTDIFKKASNKNSFLFKIINTILIKPIKGLYGFFKKHGLDWIMQTLLIPFKGIKGFSQFLRKRQAKRVQEGRDDEKWYGKGLRKYLGKDEEENPIEAQAEASPVETLGNTVAEPITEEINKSTETVTGELQGIAQTLGAIKATVDGNRTTPPDGTNTNENQQDSSPVSKTAEAFSGNASIDNLDSRIADGAFDPSRHGSEFCYYEVAPDGKVYYTNIEGRREGESEEDFQNRTVEEALGTDDEKVSFGSRVKQKFSSLFSKFKGKNNDEKSAQTKKGSTVGEKFKQKLGSIFSKNKKKTADVAKAVKGETGQQEVLKGGKSSEELRNENEEKKKSEEEAKRAEESLEAQKKTAENTGDLSDKFGKVGKFFKSIGTILPIIATGLSKVFKWGILKFRALKKLIAGTKIGSKLLSKLPKGKKGGVVDRIKTAIKKFAGIDDEDNKDGNNKPNDGSDKVVAAVEENANKVGDHFKQTGEELRTAMKDLTTEASDVIKSQSSEIINAARSNADTVSSGLSGLKSELDHVGDRIVSAIRANGGNNGNNGGNDVGDTVDDLLDDLNRDKGEDVGDAIDQAMDTADQIKELKNNKTAKSVGDAIDQVQDTAETVTKAADKMDDVGDVVRDATKVADKMDDVGDAVKGVAKVADKMDDVGDLAKSAAQIANKADNIADVGNAVRGLTKAVDKVDDVAKIASKGKGLLGGLSALVSGGGKAAGGVGKLVSAVTNSGVVKAAAKIAGSTVFSLITGIIGFLVTGITDFFKSQKKGESPLKQYGAYLFGVAGDDFGGLLKNAGTQALKWGGFGAAIGSIFPGAGTLIGGAIGALIGLIGGFFGNDPSKSMHIFKKGVNDVANKVHGFLDNTIYKIDKASGGIEKWLDNAFNSVYKWVEDKVVAAGTWFKDFWNSLMTMQLDEFFKKLLDDENMKLWLKTQNIGVKINIAVNKLVTGIYKVLSKLLTELVVGLPMRILGGIAKGITKLIFGEDSEQYKKAKETVDNIVNKVVDGINWVLNLPAMLFDNVITPGLQIYSDTLTKNSETMYDKESAADKEEKEETVENMALYFADQAEKIKAEGNKSLGEAMSELTVEDWLSLQTMSADNLLNGDTMTSGGEWEQKTVREFYGDYLGMNVTNEDGSLKSLEEVSGDAHLPTWQEIPSVTENTSALDENTRALRDIETILKERVERNSSLEYEGSGSAVTGEDVAKSSGWGTSNGILNEEIPFSELSENKLTDRERRVQYDYWRKRINYLESQDPNTLNEQDKMQLETWKNEYLEPLRVELLPDVYKIYDLSKLQQDLDNANQKGEYNRASKLERRLNDLFQVNSIAQEEYNQAKNEGTENAKLSLYDITGSPDYIETDKFIRDVDNFTVQYPDHYDSYGNKTVNVDTVRAANQTGPHSYNTNSSNNIDDGAGGIDDGEGEETTTNSTSSEYAPSSLTKMLTRNIISNLGFITGQSGGSNSSGAYSNGTYSGGSYVGGSVSMPADMSLFESNDGTMGSTVAGVLHKIATVSRESSGNSDTVVKNDCGKPSIGFFQVRAGDAVNLINDIASKDPSITLSSGLKSDMSRWTSGPMSASVEAEVKRLLSSSAGVETQKEMLTKRAAQNLNNAEKHYANNGKDIKQNPVTHIMAADLVHNFGSSGAKEKLFAPTGYPLDTDEFFDKIGTLKPKKKARMSNARDWATAYANSVGGVLTPEIAYGPYQPGMFNNIEKFSGLNAPGSVAAAFGEAGAYPTSKVNGSGIGFNPAKAGEDISSNGQYSTANGYPYYNQASDPHGHKYYGGATYKEAGCGPSSMAMVYTDLTMKPIGVEEIGDIAVKNGFRKNGGGTDYNFFPFMAQQMGVEVESIGKFNKGSESDSVWNDTQARNAVLSNLAAGNPIIARMHKPTSSNQMAWTGGGHFIVLPGIVDGKIVVNDPGNRTRTNKGIYDPQEVLATMNGGFAFKRGKNMFKPSSDINYNKPENAKSYDRGPAEEETDDNVKVGKADTTNIPKESDITLNNIKKDLEYINGFPYINQKEYPHVNKQYLSGGTFGDGGCGPTSMAMIYTKLMHLDHPAAVEDMGKFAIEGGYRKPGNGTDYNFFPYMAKKMGIGMEVIGKFKKGQEENSILNDPEALERFKANAKAGHPMVVRMHAPTSEGQLQWTSGGHFMVVPGMVGNNVLVNDPNNRGLSTVHTQEEILATMNGAFAFQSDTRGIKNKKALSQGIVRGENGDFGNSMGESKAPLLTGTSKSTKWNFSEAGSGITEKNGLIFANGYPYFNQAAGPHGDKKYGSGGTYKGGGCGPTSMAMIYEDLTNEPASVEQMGKYAIEGGYRGGNGTDYNFFPYMAKKLGIGIESIGKFNKGVEDDAIANDREALNRLQANLLAGNPIVARMHHPRSSGQKSWASDGHYMVIPGMVDGKLIVNDPGSRSNTSTGLYDPRDVLPTMNGAFAFQRNTSFVNKANFSNAIKEYDKGPDENTSTPYISTLDTMKDDANKYNIEKVLTSYTDSYPLDIIVELLAEIRDSNAVIAEKEFTTTQEVINNNDTNNNTQVVNNGNTDSNGNTNVFNHSTTGLSTNTIISPTGQSSISVGNKTYISTHAQMLGRAVV